MEESVLKATIRTDKLNKVRNAGFIPGVLNRTGEASTSVQFESIALNKVISKHGSKAKIWIEFGTDKNFGFMKEVQRFPIDGKVMHITMQLVNKDQAVKMQFPVFYHGQDELEHSFLRVHVFKSEIEVFGNAELMPDAVVIDISKKVLGDNITASDFNLPKGLKILDTENEIYASIKAMKEAEAEAEEPVVVAPEEAVTEE